MKLVKNSEKRAFEIQTTVPFFLDLQALNKKYFGAILDEKKFFITQEKYRKGNFKLLCLEELTVGNGIFGFESPDFLVLLNRIYTSQLELFVFDNHKDLLRWLLE